MRLILLLLCCLGVVAADGDATFILRDGRRLVGRWDEATGRLHLAGPWRAAIRVHASEIVRREAVPNAAEPARPEPTRPRAIRRTSDAGLARRLATVDARIADCRARLAEAEAALAAAIAALDALR
ncbi:MAG TPA: hypothetical protein VEL07_00315 [Planctomycetota bacterium]|nr:hypothetical protein [Planctomycetota bacterium]